MNNVPIAGATLAKSLLPYLETLSNIQYLLMRSDDEKRRELLKRGDQALESMVELVNADLDRQL